MTTMMMETMMMGDSDGRGCQRLFQSNQRRVLMGSWVMPPTTGTIKIKRGGDKNITINRSGGDNDGEDGGDSFNGGGRESDGSIGGGRGDDSDER